MGMIIDENGNVDFQEWKVPTSWDDITVEKFSELERFYEGKDEKFNPIDVLHILCDKTADEVMALPVEFVEKILQQMEFLQTAPKVDKPSNSIEIDGEKYFIGVQEELKVGEYVAFDTVLKADRHDYGSMLAILCRKLDEPYDSEFEAKKFTLRKAMFEKQPITKLLPLIAFFLSCWNLQQLYSLSYSKVEEELNRTQKSLESSHSVGALKKRYLKWRMKTLRKSLESSRNTSTTT